MDPLSPAGSQTGLKFLSILRTGEFSNQKILCVFLRLRLLAVNQIMAAGHLFPNKNLLFFLPRRHHLCFHCPEPFPVTFA